MTYSASVPYDTWLGARRGAIDTLAAAHAAMGEVDGPGRPLEIGRPLGHAYVLRVVAEFQAYVRDVHDLAVERLVVLSKPDAAYQPMLIAAATHNRSIDKGNADVRSIEHDFRGLGVGGLRGKLKNALAHGNQGQIDRLRARRVGDTVSWARARLPGLDRTARALDHIVWEHLHGTFGSDPW